jgi:hypothetical protein
VLGLRTKWPKHRITLFPEVIILINPVESRTTFTLFAEGFTVESLHRLPELTEDFQDAWARLVFLPRS